MAVAVAVTGAVPPSMIRRPLDGLPFAAPIHESLRAEFAALPAARRAQAWRKWLQREALLRLTGEAALRRDAVPVGVRRIAWVHTWTTVGDAVLDLAARARVPDTIALDLVIAPALAALFRGDRRFDQVVADPRELAAVPDFVLLDGLSTPAIRLKRRHFPGLRWASLRGHLLGERYDRAAFGDARIRQLFALPPGPVAAPWLGWRDDAGSDPGSASDARLAPPVRPAGTGARIAVVLGARVDAKRYRSWPQVLGRLVAAHGAPPDRPHFVLIGQGATARDDLAAFDPGFVARHAEVHVDTGGDLRDAATQLRTCDAFLGVDGGLMHVAVALGVPGLALFAGVDPRFFLRPGATMAALVAPGSVAMLDPAGVAAAAGERLRALGLVGTAASEAKGLRAGPLREGPLREGPLREGPLSEGPLRVGPPREDPPPGVESTRA